MTQWTDFLDPEGPDGAYLPWKRVEPRVGISRTTAWRLQRSGDFPKPYVVSPGRVAYKESEVEAWKASRGHRDERLAERPPVDPRESSRPEASSPAESPSILDAAKTATPASPATASQIATERAAPLAQANRKRADSRQITFDF